MTGLKALGTAALISIIPVTCAWAQDALSDPGTFQAMYPNRDSLNGGQLTPAGRLALQQAGRPPAANGAYAAAGNAGRSGSRRHSMIPAH